MKRKIPEDNRRVVSRKTKLTIIMVFLAMVLITIFYKVPHADSYVGVLQLDQASMGENSVNAYGSQINVKVNLTVHNNVLFTNGTSGTIRINNSVFKITSSSVLDVESKFHEIKNPDSIYIYSTDHTGGVTFTRCAIHIKNGKIESVTLRDSAGNHAGTYN